MDLVVWLTVVGGILGLGMGAMVWAYRRPFKNRVLFAMPLVNPTLPLSDQGSRQFQEGCEAFQRGQYARAIDGFSQVIQTEPACAEAYHNRGLAYGNLGNDGLAVAALVKASDLYGQQDTKAGLDRVKQHLELLADRQRSQRPPSQEQAQEQAGG